MMELPDSQLKVDRILLPLLQMNEDELPPVLDKLLVTHAVPIIQEIVRYRIGDASYGQSSGIDADDIRNETVLRLLTRLREFRTHPEERPIRDFEKYVAVVTHNACSEYFREKYPERFRLKNRLRYLLRHDPEFAMWESNDQEWLCGLKEWNQQKI